MKLFSRPELALEWTALPLETIKELMSKTAINLLHNTDFVHKVMTQAALELTLQAAQGSLRMLVRPRPQCNPAVLDLQVAAADPIRAEAQSSQSPQADSTESARSASAAGQSAGKLSPDLLAAAALCGSAARTTGRAQQQATAEAAAATGTADSAETDSDAAADSADNAAESTCAGTAELRKKSVLPASSKNRQFKLSLTPEEWFGSDNCQFFAPGTEAQEIEQAWQEAVAAGKAQGFVPVLVRAGTDRGLTFMQQLLRSFSRYQDVQPDPAVPLSADSLRHAVVQAATLQALPDGRELMQHLCSRLKKNVQTLHLDPQLIWPRSIKAQARSRTLSLQTAGQEQILLIKIRVAEPWQVLAFVPYEDSEHIHTLAQVLSAGKFWYDKYRAVPVLAGEGVTEFMVPRLIPRKWAPDLAEQILAWCGTYTAAHCADRKEPFSGQSVTAMLQASTVWQLHWLFR